MSGKLTIEVHFDLICPWCLIGKRHLSTAIQRFRRLEPDVEVDIAWRSQELLPDTPAEGLPYQAFYERRLGGPAAVAARRTQVQDAARPAGIAFAFERIQVLPNTRAAHQLIALAAYVGSATETADLVERLFTAYFLEGENIGDPEVLARIAAASGLERPMATEGAERPGTWHASPRQVPGVPFFVFNGRHPVSGAHPPETLLRMMQAAIATLPPTEPVGS